MGVWERWIVGLSHNTAHMKDSLCSKFLMNWRTDRLFEGNSSGAYACGCVYACMRVFKVMFGVQLSDIENSLWECVKH